jgi:hypothetical protein
MFGAGLDSGVTKTNSHGEYKVAEGVTSEIFRAILACSLPKQCNG